MSSPTSFTAALPLLACPVCHGALSAKTAETIVCTDCRRVYPVVEGIPVLLADRAVSQ